jgi:archaetidylinositol phosphate synthase
MDASETLSGHVRAVHGEDVQDATRVVAGLLAPIERRTLVWIAQRLPRGISSDQLTVLALLAMAGAGASFWLASYTPVGLVLVCACLVINWFGDSLDGTLARVRGEERPRYGYYIDHVVDAFGAVCLLGGLALSGFMAPLIALGLLIVSLLLAIEVYLAAYTLGRFKISYFLIGPTELRILLIMGTLVLLFQPTVLVFGSEQRLFDIVGIIALAGMFATLLVNVATNARTLYRAEPLSR